MSFDEKRFKEVENAQLKDEDKFSFGCSMCGSCCRRRQDPILVTGADLFLVAKYLGKPVKDILFKHTSGIIGSNSHIPVTMLNERDDGSCTFLRKGKCQIHEAKPAVCSLFPLGRYYSSADNKFHYFLNQMCGNSTDGKEWTLSEWLDLFNIRDREQYTIQWNSLMGGIASVTHKMTLNEIGGKTINRLVDYLYVNYDINRPYNLQIDENKKLAAEHFLREHKKRILY